jgi:hypothetical protein
MVVIGLISLVFSNCAMADYIPAAPSGPDFGYINIDYEYSVSTTNPEAFWMFDWGDGTYSSWMNLTGSAQSVTQSHSWNLPGAYQIRVKYKSTYVEEVWSPYYQVNISEPNETDYPTVPSIPSGKTIVTENVTFSFSSYSTDEAGDQIQYKFDWGDGVKSGWSSLYDSGTSTTMTHAWSSVGTFSIRTKAKDSYGLESSWSEPLNITIEADSDRDGLSDNIESSVGSNSNDASDVNEITIDSTVHYIIFAGSENVLFYNSNTENYNFLGINDEGLYLLDVNNDGNWDYFYNHLTGALSQYQEQQDDGSSFLPFDIPLLWIVIGIIIIVVIIIIIILLKKGYIYFYDEYTVEE